MNFLKSRLSISLFAILFILGCSFIHPAQARAAEEDSANLERWMSICDNVADNIKEKHFVYGNSGTKSTYRAAVKSRKRTNCALYVSWCLQEYGALKSGQTVYCGGSSIRKNFSHFNKKKVKIIRVNKRASKAKLKKGDVVFWSGIRHTNVYAGKNSSGEYLWYECGKSSTYGHSSGSRFKNPGKKTQSYLNSKKICYIIRIKDL